MRKKKINPKNKIIVGLEQALEHAEAQPIISLSKALDNSLDRLEQRMIDYIARVDRILA